MNELHADPLQGDVATAQSTSSAGYTDLATSGPSQTKTLVNGQKVIVIVSTRGSVGSNADEALMSFAVSGATTQAANDSNATDQRDAGGNHYKVLERTTVFTALASGSHTFTAKYKFVDGGGASTATFSNRRIIVKAF